MRGSSNWRSEAGKQVALATMRRVARFLIAIALLAPPGALAADRPNECGTKPPVESKVAPTLTKGDAMNIAVKTAQAEGYKLSQFEVPWFCFKSKEGEWLLTFNGKPVDGKRQPGFTVSIRDDTQAAKIASGS